MERICAESGGRLYGFGVLPMRDPPGCVQELRRIAKLPHLRGVILGTSGLGNGLDDPALDQVWAEAEAQQAMIFIHPHYGLGNDAFAGTGHALFLALGFTFETTTAVARLILRGTFDRFPRLKLLVAHAGGTLPWLAGRLDSCVETERQVDFKLREKPSVYLKRLYYDAIAYHTPSLRGLIEFVGADRIMFGTDHPFFPPRDPPPDLDRALWPSPRENYAAIAGLDAAEQPALLRENAQRILALPA
jgi:predicted TIM-barrel fold metal-dependent hydrolase